MLQFYFLSILLNLLTGLVLVYGKDLTTGESPRRQSKAAGILGENAFFDDKTFRRVLGVLTAFTGIMKLLSVVRSDVPVVGDLLPALAGIFGGACILIEYYRANSSGQASLPGFVSAVFVERRKLIGYVCLAAAVLHFIFPEALLL